ncbi:transposase [Neisseria meningitidis]|nr:transposase [Neisseria meningitidis]
MRKSRLSRYKQNKLIELFVAGVTARTATEPDSIVYTDCYRSYDVLDVRKFNGIPKAHFELYLKECEWRFNNSEIKVLVPF